MERDAANLYVLEGILLSLLLLGAAYAVQTLQTAPVEQVRPQAELERLVADALVVLEGLDDGNGTSLLDRYFAQALHCATAAVPSATDCDDTRSRNLSLKIESYLPIGAGYAVGIGNGAGTRELYRSPLPQGEAVATSRTFAPEWNLTFVASEFSCYEAANAVNLTLIPIDRSALSWARYANATISGSEFAGEAAHTARWWNVTLPAASRPASGTVTANVTGNASLPGSTTYGECDLQGLAATLRDTLHDVVFRAGAPSVPLGGSIEFTADISALEALAGVSVDSVNVTLYEPVAPTGADGWVSAGRVTLTGTGERKGTWEPGAKVLYGAHPALLRVGLTIGSTDVELRRILVVDVALPSGEVPIDPAYRATLQAWLPDWG